MKAMQEEQGTPPELGREQMVADLAEVLGIPVAELLEETADGDVSLVDLGLDSVRLMTLVERWQAGGRELDYVEFASDPDLETWVAAVESA